MRRSALGSIVALPLLLCACGDPFGPRVSAIEGEWSYTVSDLVSARLSCGVSGVTLRFSQRGRSFSGESSEGTITCSGPLDSFTRPFAAAPVVDGTVTGKEIRFALLNDSYRNEGELSGDTIAGRVTIREEGLILATGSFTAVRR